MGVGIAHATVLPSVEFMNSLPASDCTVRFGAPNKDNFKSLVIKLTDYENLSETYELQVRNKDEQQSYVDYNGAQYAMSGVFGTNSIMQLHLVSGTVFDYMGNVVCVIGENAFRGCGNLTIFAEKPSKPDTWHDEWNPNGCPVDWNYKDDSVGFSKLAL